VTDHIKADFSLAAFLLLPATEQILHFTYRLPFSPSLGVAIHLGGEGGIGVAEKCRHHIYRDTPVEEVRCERVADTVQACLRQSCLLQDLLEKPGEVFGQDGFPVFGAENKIVIVVSGSEAFTLFLLSCPVFLQAFYHETGEGDCAAGVRTLWGFHLRTVPGPHPVAADCERAGIAVDVAPLKPQDLSPAESSAEAEDEGCKQAVLTGHLEEARNRFFFEWLYRFAAQRRAFHLICRMRSMPPM